MAVNVKLGVDLSEFTTGIKQGQAEMKTLKAEMKATEAEFKATGNAEKALADKTKTLTQQLKTQKSIMEQADKALQEMTKAGIKPTDQAYQKMYVQMLNAKAGMNETQAALNSLNGAQQEAAAGANDLASSVSGIGKKMSLEQVSNGVSAIKSALEGAAQTALQLGENLLRTIRESAKWADDSATNAKNYGITLERYLQMEALYGHGMDTTTDAILDSQSKLERNMAAGSKTVQEAMDAMNLSMYKFGSDGKYGVTNVLKDSTELFWEAGKAIMNMSDSYKQEQYAQAIFGRNWHELASLFDNYDSLEDYQAALDHVKINGTETVENLTTLNDKLGELETNFNTLKTEVIGQLAPALSGAADALSGMLTSLLEYLEKPEGQKMLEDLGTAVSGLFEDLGKIEPDKVVEGFVGVFNGIKDTLQWMVDNKSTVEGLLIGIAGAWGAAKLTGGALQILTLINGIKGLSTASAAASAASAGTSVGASWGAAFGAAVLKAAPWMAFLGILFENAVTPQGNDDIFTKEEEKQYEQDHWLELATQRKVSQINKGKNAFLDWFNNLEDTETEMLDDPLLSLTERQRKAAEDYWDAFRSGNPMSEAFAYQDLFDVFEGVDGGMETLGQITSLIDSLKDLNQENLPEWWFGEGESLPVEVTPEIDVEAAQEQLNNTTLKVKVAPTFLEVDPSQHANGLPYVPYDGYLASLHRGERVLTASANNSYTYNSNTYFGSVNLNNGLEIDALTESIARQNRKQQSAYGS